MPHFVSRAQRIASRHNPEHDVNIAQGAPVVTWAEADLADGILALAETADKQRDTIAALEARVARLEEKLAELTRLAYPPEAEEFPHGEFPNYYELTHPQEDD